MRNTLILTAAVIMLAFFSYLSVIAEKVDEQRQQRLELKQIQNPDSVTNGRSLEERKWRGLCPKNSAQTQEELRQTIAADPVLANHYTTFDWSNATTKTTEKETEAFVYHRINNILEPTTKPIKIPKGDRFVTDGRQSIRLQCCNNYVPVVPEPPDFEFDPPSAGPPTPHEIAIPPITTTTVTWNYPIQGVNTINHRQTAPVPEPNTSLMMFAGLAMITFFKRK